MKNFLFMLALSLFVTIAHICAQIPQKICVAPTAMGTGSGFPMYNACSISNLPTKLQTNLLSGDVEVYFAGGDYYNVSLDLSGLNFPLITSIHLIGGINPSFIGNNINRGFQDWNTYPTTFHVNSSTPSASVIDINNFSLSSQNPISSVEGIIVTSDNYSMTSNAIRLVAGNFAISNCQVTNYKTTNALIDIEIGSLDSYIISSLFDNNTSGVLFRLFGYIHIINATIADNAYTYFLDGLTEDVDIVNSIVWKNSNVDVFSHLSGHAYISHSFMQSIEYYYMADDNTNQCNVDPLFTYDVDVPYTCTSNSTIFNYGDGDLLTSANVPSYMLDYDIDHNDRFYNSASDTLDVGAYQHYYDDGGANYESVFLPQQSRRSQPRSRTTTDAIDRNIWSHYGIVYVRGAVPESSRLSIYTMTGELVYGTVLQCEDNSLPVYLASGVYVAVVTLDNSEVLFSNNIFL